MVRNVNMRNSQQHSSTRFDVAGTGFTVLDQIYSDGVLADEALGGSCANVLVSLAMLQRHVAPVLRLGADAEGGKLVDEFVQAGAMVEYIFRDTETRSPVLTEVVDRLTSEHHFSFKCPITDRNHPRYQPIGWHEHERAKSAFEGCAVFYADRLSPSILDAMQVASASGAIVVFEPSEIDDFSLFAEAMECVTILKVSSDRLDGDNAVMHSIDPSIIRIVTHGVAGLEVRDRTKSFWCEPAPAPVMRDACGSGDMVSVGLIDWMLSSSTSCEQLSAETILDGVIAGQRLAAENCGFLGARGLFRTKGASFARSILDDARRR